MSKYIQILIALIGAAILFGIVVNKVAHGAPPENADPAYAPWFRSLVDKNGVGCCSMADCRQTEYRVKAGHYEAIVDGQWLQVPDDKVLTRDNPTGRAVICWLPPKGVMCFVPASET